MIYYLFGHLFDTHNTKAPIGEGKVDMPFKKIIKYSKKKLYIL